MNNAFVAKIVIALCIFSLFIGVLNIDKDKLYGVSETNQNSNSKNIINKVNKIAVVELEGAIASTAESSLFSSDTSAPNLLKSLKTAETDDNIKGVIIKINSPGGTVAMSQNIHNEIMKLREMKPVITVFDDVSASGGYYIASACDRIIAQEGTLTGSIGVIFSFMDYHNLLTDKLNINSIVIKSGKYKDIGSGMREMTEDEKTLMQDIIDDSYSQFIDAIVNGRINRNDTYTAEKRVLKPDVLKANADGRVFTGRQALKLGFVDAIGGMNEAQAMIEKMAQEKFQNSLNAKLVDYNKKSGLSEYLSGFAEYNSQNKMKITDFIPKSMLLNKRPLYLWE